MQSNAIYGHRKESNQTTSDFNSLNVMTHSDQKGRQGLISAMSSQSSDPSPVLGEKWETKGGGGTSWGETGGREGNWDWVSPRLHPSRQTQTQLDLSSACTGNYSLYKRHPFPWFCHFSFFLSHMQKCHGKKNSEINRCYINENLEGDSPLYERIVVTSQKKNQSIFSK